MDYQWWQYQQEILKQEHDFKMAGHFNMDKVLGTSFAKHPVDRQGSVCVRLGWLPHMPANKGSTTQEIWSFTTTAVGWYTLGLSCSGHHHLRTGLWLIYTLLSRGGSIYQDGSFYSITESKICTERPSSYLYTRDLTTLWSANQHYYRFPSTVHVSFLIISVQLAGHGTEDINSILPLDRQLNRVGESILRGIYLCILSVEYGGLERHDTVCLICTGQCGGDQQRVVPILCKLRLSSRDQLGNRTTGSERYEPQLFWLVKKCPSNLFGHTYEDEEWNALLHQFQAIRTQAAVFKLGPDNAECKEYQDEKTNKEIWP